MPSKASYKRHVVVLKVPKSTPAFIVYGNHIVASMTSNPWFPAPSPKLSKMTAALVFLQKAQAATLQGGMAKTTARNDARAAAHKLLQRLASYVQKVADANRENSLAIIESAGMSAKRSSGSRAHIFQVKRYKGSGYARITVPVAGDGSTYFWQMSLDGGLTWIDLPSTTQSKTVSPRLAPGTTVLFRYKTLTTKGESDWSSSKFVT